MYTEILSPSFVGMTFNQAAVLCFTKVNTIIILANTTNEHCKLITALKCTEYNYAQNFDLKLKRIDVELYPGLLNQHLLHNSRP